LWLGILTSMSPCPLATNVAAISFITRDATRPRAALTSGLLYTAGRTVAYVALGALLVSSVLSAPALSHALQTHMNRILGPLLILVGMVLLGLLRMPGVGTPGTAPGFQRRAAAMGVWGAALLGLVFALSFCPVSAALFFGSLLPLAVSNQSPVTLPLLFGIGTAIPVIVFAIVISLGVSRIGDAFARTVILERWLRRATGVTFIVVGVYLALENIFGIFS
jgi:cytochrome c biogenesis protein CcdA